LRSGCLAEGMSYEDIVREYSDFPRDSLAEVLHFAAAVTDRNDGAAWELTNGALAQAASREGFRVLLTRDRRFGASAGSTLEALPELAIVIVTLSQVREAAYLSAFDAAWRRRPIEPVAGAISEWP